MNRSGGGTTRPLRILVALASMAVFGALAAPVSAGDPPGNNGTVKVHDQLSSVEPEPSEMRNVPHVGCVFHIHGYNFDSEPAQSGDWWIVAWAPTGNGSDVADSGTYTAMANGQFEVDVDLTAWISAHPSGHNQGSHFKLFVEGRNGTAQDGTFETTQVKHKVFWVQCDVTGGQAGGNQAGSNQAGSNQAGSNQAGSNQAAGTAAGGAVMGSQGGPGGAALPNTSVPMAVAGSLGAVLLAAAGIGASAMRRRD